MQINVQIADKEIKSNPLRKIRFYQRMQTILGAIVAFVLGLCLPIVKLIIPIIGNGEMPDFILLD